MTNREKWTPPVDDQNIEDIICKKFVTPIIDKACPGCPLGSLCRMFVNEQLTYDEYMSAVSDWLDKEVEDD